MKDKKFSPPQQTALDARFEAQKIIFGPVVFQCVRFAWKQGILRAISEHGEKGGSIRELSLCGSWSEYVLQLVLESCLSAGVVALVDGRYALDKTGYCILSDELTQVNLDFMHDVCYQGMYFLEESLKESRPVGLKTLGSWKSLYEGMSQLPEPARTSWFRFDHFYSDTSFVKMIPHIFENRPHRVMDLGANTGKFSLAALRHDGEVELHLVDLPQQLRLAEETLRQNGLFERARFHPVNMLEKESLFPEGMDIIWISQFLSCFSEDEIRSILQRAARALSPGGQIYILDTLWDRQNHDIAAYCMINLSPYFTAMANGNSKVYQSGDYARLAEEAGLRMVEMRDGIGYGHTLLRLIPCTMGKKL